MAQAYKRICFHGRGMAARWLDRTFFGLLGGVSLYLLFRHLPLSVLLCVALWIAFCLLDHRRWLRYRHELCQKTATALKREDWLRREAQAIRQGGGIVLYPTPKTDELTGFCLRYGQGTAFHCFGEPKDDLTALVETFGCTVSFHSWQEGTEPSREQVLKRLRRDVPKGKGRLLPLLWHLPGNRYLLTGFVLLLLSLFLRRAIYWRLLGSFCLMFGAVLRSFRVSQRT